jgi:hypothetical protein
MLPLQNQEEASHALSRGGERHNKGTEGVGSTAGTRSESTVQVLFP